MSKFPHATFEQARASIHPLLKALKDAGYEVAHIKVKPQYREDGRPRINRHSLLATLRTTENYIPNEKLRKVSDEVRERTPNLPFVKFAFIRPEPWR